MKYIIIFLLIVFLIYMIVWTYNLYNHTKRKDKMNRIKELRAKREEKRSPGVVKEDTENIHDSLNSPAKRMKETVKEAVADSRDYWVNKQELAECDTDKERERCYHYFESVEEGFQGLLLELYDYGLVRMDELETIAYGKNHFNNMDMSFLEESDKEDDTITVLGHTDTVIVDAARNLDKNDPGIMDIKGTLSDGVENIIKAVDEEKKIEEKKKEPISAKEEKSVEKARYDRARTSSQEIRNKIFLKWDGYVSNLYDMIEIKASEETKHKIKKALRDYGYSDVDVLLKSPE